MQQIVSCDILGYGEAREGFFCGSDHCPVVLVLKSNDSVVDDGGKMKASTNSDHETDYDTDDDEGGGYNDRKMPATKKAKVSDNISAGKEIIDLT